MKIGTCIRTERTVLISEATTKFCCDQLKLLVTNDDQFELVVEYDKPKLIFKNNSSISVPSWYQSTEGEDESQHSFIIRFCPFCGEKIN